MRMFVPPIWDPPHHLTNRIQGIEGPVVFTGSTPELDDFTIRIVDGGH